MAKFDFSLLVLKKKKKKPKIHQAPFSLAK